MELPTAANKHEVPVARTVNAHEFKVSVPRGGLPSASKTHEHSRYEPFFAKALPPTSALGVRQLIVSALAEDAHCRRPGVTEGLYGLDDLKGFSRLGHGVPMIREVDYRGEPRQFSRAASDAEFRARLKHFAPFLEALDMKALGLCLAGGSASALLMRSVESLERDGYSFHDFDLFLVGHASDGEARRAIEALAQHLYHAWGMLEVYRTQNCITFYIRDGQRPESFDESHDGRDVSRFGSVLVQVILRRYSTHGEIIHGFDLGSSAVLWDGDKVVLTGLGKLAAEHGVNVLNLPARRASYERRLARYFERGFDLVLPGLSDHGLTELEGRLPYLYAHGLKGESCACSLTATVLRATRPGFNNWGVKEAAEAGGPKDEKAEEPEEQPASDYAPGTISYGNPRAILSRNVRALSGEEVRVASLCACAQYGPGMDIFGIEPLLDLETMASVVAWCFAPTGKVNVKTLRSFLGPDRAMELMIEYMGTGAAPATESVTRHCAERAVELNGRARIPFAFMRVEDKTALTGPFTRELVTKEDWYGAAGAF